MNKTKLRKEQIIRWADKNGRLPNRKSEKITERRLGTMMENYLSKKSPVFDEEFRNLVYSKFDRKVNNKREHSKKDRIDELFNFLDNNNRSPSIVVEEEKRICSTLWNYCRKNSPLYDSKVEKRVYKIDPCFRTPIPKKYRRCINEALQSAEVKLKEEQL